MSSWKELKDNPKLKKFHDERIQIIKHIREFFWDQNFLEVETPIAVKLPGQEPYLNPLEVIIEDVKSKKHSFYLRTSPEYSLKKMLAAGYENIFEISKCFRNGEDFGGTHNTEFTMLEWYRCPGHLENIMDDTEQLFKFVLKKLHKNHLSFKGNIVNADCNWNRVSMKELFAKYLEVDLDNLLEEKQLKLFASKRGYQVSSGDQYEDIFFKVFLNEIEPNLGKNKPVFVYNYPARMSSLSCCLPHDNRYAERFELYIGGLEVANAFGELLDGDEQEERLKEDKSLREKLGKKTWNIDSEFIRSLKEIKKKTASAGGIALGVDRMVVLCTGANDINEVIFNNIQDQLSSIE